MLTINRRHLTILDALYYSPLSVTDIINITGYSPSAVVKKINDMSEWNFVKITTARKYGGGRGEKIAVPTEEGKQLIELLSKAELIELRGRGALAGPRMTFLKHGINFSGRRDVFMLKGEEAVFFDVVVCDKYIFDDGTTHGKDDFEYPGIEEFIIWVVESRNPRYISAAIKLIMKEKESIDFSHLKYLAVIRHDINRISLMLDLAGAGDEIDMMLLSRKTEKLLGINLDVSEKINALGRKYRVANLPDASMLDGGCDEK